MASAVAPPISSSHLAIPTSDNGAQDGEAVRYPVRHKRSETKTLIKESSEASSGSTRQLRSRTIVTTASSVSTRTKTASKVRPRTQTYIKNVSSPPVKPSPSLKPESKRQTSPAQKSSKGKQSMIPNMSTQGPNAAKSTPKLNPARTLVHQDSPGGATIHKTTSGLGDKPRLFNGSTSRAFQLSNPNSPIHTPQSTPKRLSILHISFDKENTPPAPQVADEPSVVTLKPASPSAPSQNHEPATSIKGDPQKHAKKSLLPKRSGGLRRALVNPSPASAKGTPPLRLTAKLNKLKNVHATAGSSTRQKLDLSDPEKCQSKPTITNPSHYVDPAQVSDQIGVDSTLDLTKAWEDKPVTKDIQKSPIKFHEHVPSHLDKPTEVAAVLSAPIARTLPNQTESKAPVCPEAPLVNQTALPRSNIARSGYSLAPSDCSPLLAAVLTRPLMQSSFYSQRSSGCQSCKCQCLPLVKYSYSPQPRLEADPLLQESPLSFLGNYESYDRCSRLWPDEGPDKEVEKTMASPLCPESRFNRSQVLKNPIAVTFTDEPLEDYNFHPIHVPSKQIIQKAESAFNRIIVC